MRLKSGTREAEVGQVRPECHDLRVQYFLTSKILEIGVFQV